jgi:hypothetical protein
MTVSADAVVKRINRVLEAENPGEFLRIKKTRGVGTQLDLGDYYLLDGSRNVIVERHLDLEDTAKQYKVLAPTEKIRLTTQQFNEIVVGAQAMLPRRYARQYAHSGRKAR